MNFNELLKGIPETLRDELISTYSEIDRNFRERRWEPSELNGGKLCEVVYTIIKGHVDGSFPNSASKPSNMVAACRNLEQAGATVPRSLRIQIPRMMIALYEIRNNRGVGHVGGDVDPNEMDATCVLQMAKWIVCELVRVFHCTSTSEAESLVGALSERELPLIWRVDDVVRVLDTTMSSADKTLALLYSCADGLAVADLVRYIEYSNASVYRKTVMSKLHGSRLLEFNSRKGTAKISPLGARHVETVVLG